MAAVDQSLRCCSARSGVIFRCDRAALVQTGGDEEAQDGGAIAVLGVPVAQAVCLATSRAAGAG